MGKGDQIPEEQVVEEITPTDFVPSEEQILKELKQKAARKKYMNTPAAKEARKKYMQKRYEQAKAMREYMKENPSVVEELKKKHGLE